MADIREYLRLTSFTDYQSADPSAPLNGVAVDAEFDNIKLTLDGIDQSLDLMQDDEGRLRAGIVTADSLAPGLYSGLEPPTAWATSTAYAVNDTVFFDDGVSSIKLYRCLVAHTSGTFSADLAAVYWTELADFTPPGVVGTVAIASGGTGATDAATARTNLGIGAVAVEAVLPVAKGGTGSTSAADARTALSVYSQEQVLDRAGHARSGRVINGNFDIWDRGAGAFAVTTTGVYTANQWRADVSGGTLTISQQSHSLADVFGLYAGRLFARVAASGFSGTAAYGVLRQPIEDVRSYAGQTVTILGWAKRGAGTGDVHLEVEQSFGTGGSPSTEVTHNAGRISLTGSWAPFAKTVTLSSISGKTLGSNGNDHLMLTFWLSAGSDFNARTDSLGHQTVTVDLAGVHIVPGTVTTAGITTYMPPTLAEERAACDRFYEYHDIYVVDTTDFHQGVNAQPFRAEKRATPTLAVTPASGTGAAVVAMGRSGWRQIVANSASSTAVLTASAEL